MSTQAIDTKETKVFDESYVDCNQCQHYWDDSCDAVPTSQIRSCTAFKATRQTNIPLQLEKLYKRQKQSDRSILCCQIIICLHLLCDLIVAIWGG